MNPTLGPRAHRRRRGARTLRLQDIERLSRREIVASVTEWREGPGPAAALIETPVFRQESGLREHQKYFAKLAFERLPGASGMFGERPWHPSPLG